MKVGVYYRVSTDKQTYISQKADVERFVRERYPTAKVVLYTDKASGKNMDRVDFRRLMTDVANKEIQAVVVYKLDRFSRSVHDAWDSLKILKDNKCVFHSVTQPVLDTSAANPFGEVMIALFGTLAQMERETLVERIKAGQAASKKKAGRKQSIPQELRDRIKEQYAAGRSIRLIAEDTGVSSARVHVIAKEQV